MTTFSRKLTFCTKTLHSLQDQSSVFHYLKDFLNLSKSLISFRLPGTRSHIFGPRFETLSVPLYTVFIQGLENSFIRMQTYFFKKIHSFRKKP